MKVKELIAELQKYGQEAEVKLEIDLDDQTYERDVSMVDQFFHDDPTSDVIIISK